MDDLLAINLLKTEIREAYNTSTPERMLVTLDDNFICYADGRQSTYRERARQSMRKYLEDLFARHNARLVPLILEIKVMGDVAVDYGWHELTLTPKQGGAPVSTRTRYFDLWKRTPSGQWKLAMFMDNADVPDQMMVAPAA